MFKVFFGVFFLFIKKFKMAEKNGESWCFNFFTLKTGKSAWNVENTKKLSLESL